MLDVSRNGVMRVESIKRYVDYLEKLGFSENYKTLICIGFGYPAETPAAKPRDKGKVKFID